MKFWQQQPTEAFRNGDFGSNTVRLGLFDFGSGPEEAFLSPTIHRLTEEATVDTVCRQGQEWRVKYQGSLWRARALGGRLSLFPGDMVYVVARRGNVLLVDLS
ncbi:MAG: NfeD family protein [Nodosilinea sp.]